MADARSMAGTVRADIKGAKELVERFGQMPPELRENLIRQVTDLTFELYRRAQQRASDDVLKVKTGRFLRSLKPSVSVSAARVRGKVRSVGLGRRAGLLEFGGKTDPREIAPKKAKALHFLKGGGELFAGLVHHPGARIRKHPVLYGALDEMRGEILEKLEGAATVGVK